MTRYLFDWFYFLKTNMDPIGPGHSHRHTSSRAVSHDSACSIHHHNEIFRGMGLSSSYNEHVFVDNGRNLSCWLTVREFTRFTLAVARTRAKCLISRIGSTCTNTSTTVLPKARILIEKLSRMKKCVTCAHLGTDVHRNGVHHHNNKQRCLGHLGIRQRVHSFSLGTVLNLSQFQETIIIFKLNHSDRVERIHSVDQ